MASGSDKEKTMYSSCLMVEDLQYVSIAAAPLLSTEPSSLGSSLPLTSDPSWLPTESREYDEDYWCFEINKLLEKEKDKLSNELLKPFYSSFATKYQADDKKQFQQFARICFVLAHNHDICLQKKDNKYLERALNILFTIGGNTYTQTIISEYRIVYNDKNFPSSLLEKLECQTTPSKMFSQQNSPIKSKVSSVVTAICSAAAAAGGRQTKPKK